MVNIGVKVFAAAAFGVDEGGGRVGRQRRWRKAKRYVSLSRR
jgi:hypothetical protein